MSEIMGIIRSQYHLTQQKYDVIVLDTPRNILLISSKSAKIQRFLIKLL